MKLPYIMVFFPPLREMLCSGGVELFAEASELFTHAVFQLLVVRKKASSRCILQRAKKDGSRRVLNPE
jgi:hypothetical protein